ncbi:hypothetical protein LR48_Vigan07g204800 [Vigna angularis]|uniref:Uncharacterized protein n=1 Tax=Phaseolus angularis TaxID=3914 RepID=A0A0L9V0Q9_PHAAN|nr:hypothetical protein LR48_Vigan07g204800 [Vigna angularis]
MTLFILGKSLSEKIRYDRLVWGRLVVPSKSFFIVRCGKEVLFGCVMREEDASITHVSFGHVMRERNCLWSWMRKKDRFDDE